MKHTKRLTAVLAALTLTLSMAACSGETGTTSSEVPSGNPSVESTGSTDSGNGETAEMPTPVEEDGKMAYALTPGSATIHGRYALEKHADVDAYTFSHGAAGLTVNFTGTDLWMYVPEIPTEDKDGVKTDRVVDVAVVVDSDWAMNANMIKLTKAGWVQVASGLADGDHKVEIRKQSRGFFGIMQSDWFCVSKLAVNKGGSLKTPDPISDLVIEVYGDSISNGDAVWLNEDGTNSSYTYGNWTGVLERLLDAEVRVTANTGNGLLGWVMAESGNGKVENLLPPQANWSVIDPQHNTGKWDHTGANAADVVIINLGTNDRKEMGGGDLTDTAFEDEYIRFIKEIKADCPDAVVICTVGAMGLLKGDNFDVDFGRICSEANAVADEKYCYYLELIKGNDMLGGLGWDNGHPSNLAGELYGLQLANIINARLDLGLTLPDDVPEEAYLAKVDVSNPGLMGTAFDSGCKIYGEGTAEAHSANRINDGNTGTGWQPQDGVMGKDVYVGINFKAAASCTGVTITWEDATRCDKSTSGYVVEVTEDGNTWKAPAGIKYNYGADADGKAIDKVTFDKTSIKGVRVICLKNSPNKGTYASHIYELEIQSDSAGLPEGNLIEAATGRTDMISSALAILN